MQKNIYIFAIILLTSCSAHKSTGIPSYDDLYEDSFEILLHSLPQPYTLPDTIYTEMYIALKAINHGNEQECAMMVCEKVDELMKIDTVKVNQLQYLDAKLIAQSVLNDIEGFIRTSHQIYNLYPENSIERLSSLGALFLATSQKDSADYYLNRCLQVSKEKLTLSNMESKEQGIIGILHSLTLLEKDQEAKAFIQEQLLNNYPDSIIELLESFNKGYDDFKIDAWNSVNSLLIKHKLTMSPNS